MLDRRSILKMATGGAVLTLIPTSQLLAKTSGKRLAMVFDVRRCTGCMSCTVSCAIENNTDIGRNRTRVTQAAIENNDAISTLAFPHQCNHCSNPICVDVCPAQATYKREQDGIVVIDYDKCIHCQRCVKACPYGARQKDSHYKKPPEKCNFCIHRVAEGLLPTCVETCIGKARNFGDLNNPNSTVSKLVKNNDVYAMLLKEGTQPNIFYIGLPKQIDDKEMLSMNFLDWQR